MISHCSSRENRDCLFFIPKFWRFQRKIESVEFFLRDREVLSRIRESIEIHPSDEEMQLIMISNEFILSKKSLFFSSSSSFYLVSSYSWLFVVIPLLFGLFLLIAAWEHRRIIFLLILHMPMFSMPYSIFHSMVITWLHKCHGRSEILCVS